MTSGPDEPESAPPPLTPGGGPGWAAPPPPPPPGGPYGAPAAYGAPAYYPPMGYGVSAAAPYGLDPRTGIPYSDKQKLVAGLLQIFLGGFGVGRFYIGDTKIGVIQIVVTFFTCGLGSIWGLVDGIIMLATDSKDAHGYLLRP